MKREEGEEGVGSDGEGSKSERGGEAEEGRERWPERRPEESEAEVAVRWRREARAAPEMERSHEGGGVSNWYIYIHSVIGKYTIRTVSINNQAYVNKIICHKLH